MIEHAEPLPIAPWMYSIEMEAPNGSRFWIAEFHGSFEQITRSVARQEPARFSDGYRMIGGILSRHPIRLPLPEKFHMGIRPTIATDATKATEGR